MSKARELARAIININRDYNCETLPDEIENLAKAVLSEPDPGLKGFIKITSWAGGQEILPLNTIAMFRDQGIVLNTGRVIGIRESLNELEQKIREAV